MTAFNTPSGSVSNFSPAYLNTGRGTGAMVQRQPIYTVQTSGGGGGTPAPVIGQVFPRKG